MCRLLTSKIQDMSAQIHSNWLSNAQHNFILLAVDLRVSQEEVREVGSFKEFSK